jgi:hypothetical protein
MRVSELMDALRESNPDAEVITCLKVPDADGDYLLFSESPASFAEPYPGNDAKFLVHTTVTLGGLVSQACDSSIIRDFAKALDNEADTMESDSAGC